MRLAGGCPGRGQGWDMPRGQPGLVRMLGVGCLGLGGGGIWDRSPGTRGTLRTGA